MGLFTRFREAENKQAETDLELQNPSPAVEAAKEGEKSKNKENVASRLKLPSHGRSLDPDARPSRFAERLSIATATSSEIGRSHRPRRERFRQLDQVSADPRRIEPPGQAPLKATKADQERASMAAHPIQPVPAQTKSTGVQAPATVPQRSATFVEKASDANVPIPGLQRRHTTAKTRYLDMLLDLDKIPRLHNILASFSTWILLAGYLVFPATFNSIQQDQQLDQHLDSGLETKILNQVKNAPLLYVAAAACGIGVTGCLFLWLQHRRNYIWVINRIFLPVFMNSIAGLISTLVNVYSAQQGQYSITAKVTVTVTGACTVVGAGLFLLYNNLALEMVKKRHRRDTEGYQREIERLGQLGEVEENEPEGTPRSGGFLKRWFSRVNKPGMEPESVV